MSQKPEVQTSGVKKGNRKQEIRGRSSVNRRRSNRVKSNKILQEFKPNISTKVGLKVERGAVEEEPDSWSRAWSDGVKPHKTKMK